MPNIKSSSLPLPWVTPGRKSNKSWGFSTNFYRTKRWRNLRQWHLSEYPLCVECEKDGLLISGTVVDHIIPRRERQDLELDETNLQTMCDSCHNKKSRAERSGKFSANSKGRGRQNPQNQPSANRWASENAYTCKTQDKI